MAAFAPAAAFFAAALPSGNRNCPGNGTVRSVVKVQAQAQVAPMINKEAAAHEKECPSSATSSPLAFCSRMPGVRSAEFGLGKILEGSRVFRQIFAIRSYEIGAHKTASIETLMNHLQETALNRAKAGGFLANGFGATPEMSKIGLIWVVGKIQLLVEYYPSGSDLVQVDTWMAPAGRNGLRQDWHVTDYSTGKTILRATSTMVTMNKVTRKLSRMPEQVRAEMGHCFLEQSALREEDRARLSKPWQNDVQGRPDKQFVRKGLTPRWGDIDVNQHVNNVKYIGWLLESVPVSILEKHEMTSMTLEYRRECGRDSVLQSTTTICDDEDQSADRPPRASVMRLQHLLQLDCGADVVKAVTQWRPKRA